MKRPLLQMHERTATGRKNDELSKTSRQHTSVENVAEREAVLPSRTRNDVFRQRLFPSVENRQAICQAAAQYPSQMELAVVPSADNGLHYAPTQHALKWSFIETYNFTKVGAEAMKFFIK